MMAVRGPWRTGGAQRARRRPRRFAAAAALIVLGLLAQALPTLPSAHAHSVGVSGADLAVACMLLGTIAFIMSLFYLVNNHDEDVRQYSWEVLSTTIAIFTAVLSYQVLDGFVEFALKLMLTGSDEDSVGFIIICVDWMHFLFWYVVMQCAVAKLAYEQVPEDLIDRREQVEDQEQKLKCWATLLSHMAAFAALDAGGEMQHLKAFSGRPLLALIPVVLTGAALFGLFRLADFIRGKIGRKARTGSWDLNDENCDQEEVADEHKL
eukprot:gb/GFBE01033844.1/.p1 GENE.gb/GFBE01033844.1/~~gb/GFBE01033844.1/.p1  ORF type:complete len:265 (+),score=56.16 gb/GFBE01033844.1/:1-795(+)